MGEASLREMLVARAAEHPARVAAIGDRRQWTYGDLLAMTGAADALAGVGPALDRLLVAYDAAITSSR